MPRGTNNENDNNSNSNRRYSQAPPPLVEFNLNNIPPSRDFGENTKNCLNMWGDFRKASELYRNNQGVTIAELTKNQ